MGRLSLKILALILYPLNVVFNITFKEWYYGIFTKANFSMNQPLTTCIYIYDPLFYKPVPPM